MAASLANLQHKGAKVEGAIAKYNLLISEQDSLIGAYSSYQSFRDLEGQVGSCKHIDIEACLDISTTSTQEELQTSAEITKAPKSIACTPSERYAIAPNSGQLMADERGKKVNHPPALSTSRLGHKKVRCVIEDKTTAVTLLQQQRPYHIKKSKSGLHHFRERRVFQQSLSAIMELNEENDSISSFESDNRERKNKKHPRRHRYLKNNYSDVLAYEAKLKNSGSVQFDLNKNQHITANDLDTSLSSDNDSETKTGWKDGDVCLAHKAFVARLVAEEAKRISEKNSKTTTAFRNVAHGIILTIMAILMVVLVILILQRDNGSFL